ncbi:MAG: cobalt-precorrin-6A reductase [Rhodobacterales bacterium]|nr:MAG: cobalt-precorrin-6A reductase [Rhodobacterales bacterium]
MKLLLLAGTHEARQLAALLAQERRVTAIASLAGVTRQPEPLPIPTRIGRFGGRAAFVEYLHREGIEALLDATHPFAAKISQRCAEVAREMGLPHLQLLRPPWRPRPGDDWHFIDHEGQAAEHIPSGATVLLATGSQSLHRFDNMPDRHLICRQIRAPKGAFPHENGEYLIGRPPFSVDQEIRLFKQRGIDWLVVKNAGGQMSQSKLLAARALGIPVLLINRPPAPDCARVETVQAALSWVRGL